MDVDREHKDVKKNRSKIYKYMMRFSWFRNFVNRKVNDDAFPNFIQKTDETRIQNAPFYLQNKTPVVVTEKIDGQSGTFYLKRLKDKTIFGKAKYEFGVCSRNRRLTEPDDSSYWTVAKKYKLDDKLHELIGYHEYIVIQGECIAPKVQGNKYYVTEPDLYVFNIITSDKGRLGSVTAEHICKEIGLKFVPILDTNYILPDTVQEMLEYAHGTSRLADVLREGVVVRSQDGKQSFKAVDPLFLLKHDE